MIPINIQVRDLIRRQVRNIIDSKVTVGPWYQIVDYVMGRVRSQIKFRVLEQVKEHLKQ